MSEGKTVGRYSGTIICLAFSIILVCLLCLTPQALASEHVSNQITSDNIGDTETINKTFSLLGYKGGVGVSFKQVTLDLMEGSDHLVVATIGNELSPIPVFNLQSPVKFFGRSRVGYYIVYECGGFNLDLQESFFAWEPQWQDMGTSVRGFFISATPVLALETPERSNTRIRLNFGIGLGYLSLSGDVIIYRDFEPDQPFRQKVDINEPALNCYLSTEFIGSKGQAGFKVGWLQGKSNGYHYYLTESAITVFWTRVIG